uniref:TFIIS-type domain-containing protein n=1 Tax=viral metagenome TaxID=1070528 RepID=A0A6C0K0V6_9ZZZZ
MRKIDNPDSFRNNIRGKLEQLLESKKKAINLEKGIYNYALKEANNRKVVKKWDNPYYVQIYLDRMRTIYLNLAKPSLLTSVKEGLVTVKTLAFMTHQEMQPEKWNALIQAKIKKDKSKYDTQQEAMTDTFKCRKCHSNKCSYYQMQTRSADEPMTTFVTCIECANRWKC